MNTTAPIASPIEKRVQEILDERLIGYYCQFIPQSKSRNKDAKEPSLNWLVAFKHSMSRQLVTAEYTQGIAHVPGYHDAWLKRENLPLYELVAETGRYLTGINTTALLPEPTSAAVLHSIILDINAATLSFKEWCAELGYDDDSIKNLKVYEACRRQAVDAYRVFGAKLIDQLREVMADY